MFPTPSFGKCAPEYTNLFAEMMTLDLILAAQMRSYSALQSRLNAFGISTNDLRAALISAEQAGIMQRRVHPSEYIAYVGQPDHVGPNGISYNLRLWPDHRFDFGFHESGWLLYRGFTLREIVPSLARPTPLSAATAQRVFRTGFHTRAQIYEALGPAPTRQGWNGMEDLFYTTDSATSIAFEFDFGLLTGISERNPIVL